MKQKYIFIILGIIVLILILVAINKSRNNSNPENQTTKQEKEKPLTIEEIKAKELATGIKNDTALFGLYFGMPREKAISKLKQLEKEKRIENLVIDEIPLASYKMSIKDYNLTGLLICGFYNNELSVVRLNFKSPLNASLSNYQTYNDLCELYGSKYGQYYEMTYLSGKSGHWINGNREIIVSRLDDPDGAYCMITYQDSEREKLQNAEKQKEAEKESSKTKEEI